MNAKNARIVLLSGTPIINYPNEIGILFNILRGYIRSWTFPINVTTSEKITTDTILNMFDKENFKTYDYVEYNGNVLTVTRNPFGFVNAKKRGAAKGTVRITKKEKGKEEEKGKEGKEGGGSKKTNLNKTKKHNTKKKNLVTSIEPDDSDVEDIAEENYQRPLDLYDGGGIVFDKYDGVKICPNCKNYYDTDDSNAVCTEECGFPILNKLTEEEAMNYAMEESKKESIKESKKGEEESKKGEESKNFHIYTTGILDSGNLCAVINAWEKIVRERIIDKIRPHYNNIYIHHYDMHPIDNIGKLTMEKVLENEKKYDSEFKNEKINLNIIDKNHIIIDFAHIFKYTNDGPILNNFVLDSYSTNYSDYKPKFKLNVVYFGYIGEYQISDEGFSSHYIAKSDDFIQIKYGKIITYIDGLLLHEKTEEIIDPSSNIEKIFKKVRNKVLEDLKIEKPFDLVFNKNISENVVKSIIEQIIEQINIGTSDSKIVENVITENFSYLKR
jgi:hypothetical protein